jgi:hypothetical protein
MELSLITPQVAKQSHRFTKLLCLGVPLAPTSLQPLGQCPAKSSPAIQTTYIKSPDSPPFALADHRVKLFFLCTVIPQIRLLPKEVSDASNWGVTEAFLSSDHNWEKICFLKSTGLMEM